MFRLSTRKKPKITHHVSLPQTNHTSVKPTMTGCMSLQYKVTVGSNPLTHNPFTVWLFQFFSIQDILVFRCVNQFGYNWCQSILNLKLVKNIVSNECGPNFEKNFNIEINGLDMGQKLVSINGDFINIHDYCPPGYYKKKNTYETFDLTRLVRNGKAKFLEKHLYQVKLFVNFKYF